MKNLVKYVVLSASLYKGRRDNAGDKELIVRIQLGQLASIGVSRHQDVIEFHVGGSELSPMWEEMILGILQGQEQKNKDFRDQL